MNSSGRMSPTHLERRGGPHYLLAKPTLTNDQHQDTARARRRMDALLSTCASVLSVGYRKLVVFDVEVVEGRVFIGETIIFFEKGVRHATNEEFGMASS